MFLEKHGPKNGSGRVRANNSSKNKIEFLLLDIKTFEKIQI